MHRIIIRSLPVIVFAALLAACAGSPATEPASSQPATSIPAAVNPTATVAQAAQPTAASAATEAVPVTAPTVADAPANAPAAGTEDGARTFQIVPEQSSVSYEVQEKFMNRELPNQAIGKTQSISGVFQVNLNGKPSAQVTKIEVDLRTLASDEGRRDNRIRTQWLESNTYPLATFVSTGIEGGPESYTEGQPVSFKLPGNLTVRNITLPVTFDVQATLAGDTITGTATTMLMMKDFGIDPPNIAGMLTVTDGVTVTVNFTAKEVK